MFSIPHTRRECMIRGNSVDLFNSICLHGCALFFIFIDAKKFRSITSIERRICFLSYRMRCIVAMEHTQVLLSMVLANDLIKLR